MADEPDEEARIDARAELARVMAEGMTELQLDTFVARQLTASVQGGDARGVERYLTEAIRHRHSGGPAQQEVVAALFTGDMPFKVAPLKLRRKGAGRPKGSKETRTAKKRTDDEAAKMEAMISRLRDPNNASRKEVTDVLKWGLEKFGGQREALRKRLYRYRLRNAYLQLPTRDK